MDADDNLVRMANRIGDFFAAQPDHEEALAGIAEHLRKFWAPRMRADFLAAVDAGAPALHPLVREAVTLHRTLLAPAAVR
ncbi:formate dehydrogenase subunit delta [Pseudacidovorax sp. RU35E]|uniref:formate dehydrogenase subunit delta n=1 Tax=Pseudacidovorax sp. RU35E TaxID=1907403 RepID=UPI000955426F|nr:formate dehydrogenase subunit delta [Pseudacidovorax sp. RU35E]SIR63680.1 formate dehydrogenase delta subunit [Pseudacidovorax sp. RU35E]